jgi:hypothetical protein
MIPISRIAAISSDVAIGRRMNGRDGFIQTSGYVVPAAGARDAGRRRGLPDDDLRAALQLVEAVRHQLLARLDPGDRGMCRPRWRRSSRPATCTVLSGWTT